jgi:hypothetical protein
MNTCGSVIRANVMFCYRITKMENSNLEQCYAIKVCVKLGEDATDTYEKIQKAFANYSDSRAQVFQWHKDFANVQEMAEDELLSGLRACENKQKCQPCESFHSSRLMFDNLNDHR